MLSSATTMRNLFILLGALAIASGCTTAKTLGTPQTAIAATAAPSSDTGTAEAAESTTDTGTAEAAESTTDTGTAEAAESSDESLTPPPLTLWVVNQGEHLWGISAHEKVYGDAYQWPLLFKRNRHQIEDADLIFPGQVLHIERELSNSEIDRAIEHAKTRGAWVLGITELTDLEYLSRERGHE